MTRYALVLALTVPLFGGCDLFKKAKETVEGVLNPTVGVGFLVGVEEPQDPEVDLKDNKFQPGTALTLFLADAKSATDIANAPIDDATVIVDGNVTAPAESQDSGLYTVAPPNGLVYEDDGTWTIEAEREGQDEPSVMTLHLPKAANITIEKEHDANTPISLDFTGLGYHAALIVVTEVATGTVTYSNEPKGAKEAYDFAFGKDTIAVEEIPATAFPNESIYAVGVAGMVHTTTADLDNMNTALSKVLAGKMRFVPVSTIPVEK